MTTELITSLVKNKVQTIVNVFETSSLNPRYDILVCLNDGPGGIKQVTFGKQQTTEFGNLKALIKAYCERSDSRYASDLKSYLDFIGNPKHPLANNLTFKTLLKLSGTDVVMHQVQDEFFDRYYWNPAFNFFSANLFTLPLSMAVIYDSYIHSGGIPVWLRKEFPGLTPLNHGDEKEWVKEYVTTRDNWLEHHPNKVLRGTDYRTDAWIEQIKNENWNLSQPVVCKFNSANEHDWVTIP
jgi:chitosanase